MPFGHFSVLSWSPLVFCCVSNYYCSICYFSSEFLNFGRFLSFHFPEVDRLQYSCCYYLVSPMPQHFWEFSDFASSKLGHHFRLQKPPWLSWGNRSLHFGTLSSSISESSKFSLFAISPDFQKSYYLVGFQIVKSFAGCLFSYPSWHWESF